MTDVLYLLITLASFALLALLVGLIDRRLDDRVDGGGNASNAPRRSSPPPLHSSAERGQGDPA